jgi:cell wall-associated NlpC family hydrolase
LRSRTSRTARGGRATALVAVLAVALTMLAGLVGPAATADPNTLPSAQDVAKANAAVGSTAQQVGVLEAQLAQSQAQMEALGVAVGQAAEAYDGALYALQQAQQQSAAAGRAAATAQADLAAARQQVGELGAAAYKSGGSLATFAAFLTGSSPDGLLGAASTMQVLANRQDAVLDRVRAQQVVTQVLDKQASSALAAVQQAADKARVAKATVEAKVSAQAGQVQQLTAGTATLTRQLAALQARSSQLTAARQAGLARIAREKAARAAELARQQAAARAASSRSTSSGGSSTGGTGGGSGSGASTGSPAGTGIAPGPGGSSSGTAADGLAAVAFARAHLGDTYVWAAAGPSTWDCSGLTMVAWQAGGVSMPHYAAAQYAQGLKVSRDQLRPGDLVFFGTNPSDYQSIYHVGIYIGGGQMIEAPYTGSVVRISSIDRPSLFGFARP